MNLKLESTICYLRDVNNKQLYTRDATCNTVCWYGFYNNKWEEITDPICKDLLEYEYRQAKLKNEI